MAEPKMALLTDELCGLCDAEGVTVVETDEAYSGVPYAICESCARQIVAMFPAPPTPGDGKEGR